MRRIAVLDAPSNLGLRPPTATSVPGCAKAPGALRDHGLLSRLGARDAGCLTPPRYDAGDWRPGDGVAHAAQIAAYSRALADRIAGILDAGEFPVILGGDCSILLGSGIAMNRLGEAIGGRIGLVFVDGHSDFRHPGNASYVGAAAGEDLALVTGRGQADLAAIEGRRPYFRDVDVVVLGIRAQDEHRLDLQAAGIVNRPVPALRAEGAARSAQWAREQLADCAGYWVHIDVDVLDPAVMPAVDAPSPGGIAFPELELLLAGLVESPHCLGVEITVFDPDYDPDGEYAAEITSTVSAGLAAAHHVALRPDLAAARRDLDSTPSTPAAPGTTEAARLGPVAKLGPRPPHAGPPDDDPAKDGLADRGLAEDGLADGGLAEDRLTGGGLADGGPAEDEESAREHRRAEAAAESVSLAATGASSGVAGTPEEPALPATTLLGVEDGADLPAEQPLTDDLEAGTAEADSEAGDDSADTSSEPSDHAFAEPSQETTGETADEPSDTDSLEEAGPAETVEIAADETTTESLDEPSGRTTTESLDEPSDEMTTGSLDEPSDEMTSGSLDEPAGEPSDEAVTGPFDEPAGEPSDEVVIEQFDEPAGQPSDEAVIEPIEEPAGEPSDEAVGGPFDEPAGEPSAEAIVEPSYELADEVATEPPDEAADAVVADPSAEVVAESSAEPAAGVVAEPSAGIVAEPSGAVVAEPSGAVASEAGAAVPGNGRANGRRSRLGPRRGETGGDIAAQLLSRPLGSAPLLDSDPLPATRPGMLRPRRTEPDDEARSPEGFSLPVQRPAFDVGSDEPADIT